MKKLNQVLALGSVAVIVGLSNVNLNAQDRPQGQGRGNFDPEQMRQRMMERYREQLEVKDDAEWKILEERISKVVQARTEVGFGGRGGFGGNRGGGRDGANAQGDQGGDRRPRGFGGERSAEAEELQKAIENKASNDEIKAKLAKYREARKQKEANLTKAREDLRKVLSVKQEANAVLMGLLD